MPPGGLRAPSAFCSVPHRIVSVLTILSQPPLPPPPSPRRPHLPPRPVPQRWDEELAAFAKAYAQQCVWGHNKERGRRGENLFAITDEGMDVPLAMEEWHHEREHYNLSAATCHRGQMCGHYTQVRGLRSGGGHLSLHRLSPLAHILKPPDPSYRFSTAIHVLSKPLTKAGFSRCLNHFQLTLNTTIV